MDRKALPKWLEGRSNFIFGMWHFLNFWALFLCFLQYPMSGVWSIVRQRIPSKNFRPNVCIAISHIEKSPAAVKMWCQKPNLGTIQIMRDTHQITCWRGRGQKICYVTFFGPFNNCFLFWAVCSLKKLVFCKMKNVTSRGRWGGSAPVSPNDTWGRGGVKNMPKSVTYYLNDPLME